MRCSACRVLPLLILLASCAHSPPPRVPPSPEAAAAAEPLAPAYPTDDQALAHEAPPAPAFAPTTAEWTPISNFKGVPLVGNASLIEYSLHHQHHAFDLKAVIFDDRQFDLQVIDQPEDWAGGSKISECLRSVGAVAGVNGGFFTPEFAPMGLMLANGRATGTWQSNALLTGVVVVTSHLQLLWNAEVNPKAAHQLVQAGPRLVDAGQAVPGLDRKKRSTRTFIATDGAHQWVVGLCEDATLGELAEILATPGLMPAFTVHRALNLDGGRSSALYYRTAEGREHASPGWSTVRNYLGIIPR